MNYHVRTGKTSDLPRVLELIRELAEYEKAPLEVTTTVESMERDSSGPEPAFRFFVAETEGMINGIAVYYMKYSTWKGRCLFLEDIIVTENLRGKGIGKALFEAAAREAARLKVPRMEWQVLDWNESAIRFYEKLGTIFDREWINCKLTDKELERFI